MSYLFSKLRPLNSFASFLRNTGLARAGVPEEIVLDPASTNLGGPVTGKAEDQGCTVRPIAAEAILQKIVAQHHPENKEACLECVTQANVKNAMIQVHGHTPHQYVFGQNPRVPSDLYEPPYA